jgi:NTE family protein
LKIFFSFLLIILFPVLVQAQTVALVLSGGGAKGLTHVSILKELERQNIPIDYVIGTSMGAVVGGFYAAGYTPEEIETIVLSRDFQRWINGQSGDYYNNHFFSKDPDPTFFSIGLDVKESITASFKNTFANDAIINYKLSELLAQASQISGNDFDSLFIPFRAVASEIFRQEEIILKSGLLSEAVRASMAVPFFYNPVRVNNDMLLFDGGIYNNFPVDVARSEFNPDIIIGVNVSTPLFSEYPYDDDEKLVNSNLFMYLLNKSNPALLLEKDIYVEPDLKGMSGADFSKVVSLLDSGAAAIARKMPEIIKKIERRMDPEERQIKRQEFKAKSAYLSISSIQFRGFNPQQSIFLSNLFQLRKKSDLSMEDIRLGYYKLAAEDYFNRIYPRLSYDKIDSTFILELQGRGDNSLKVDFGGYITSRNFSELFLGFRFNTFKKYLAEHAIHAYTGSFYQSLNYYSRFIIPGKNLFYLEPLVTYNNWDFLNISDILLNENTESSFVQQNDLRAGINIGLPLGKKYRLVLQGFYLNNGNLYSNTSQLQSSDKLDELKFDGLRSGILLSKNSLNRILYPSEGEKFELETSLFHGKERYKPGTTSIVQEAREDEHSWIRFGMHYEKYISLGRKFSGGWLLESVISNQPFFSNYEGTILNAPEFNPLNDSKTRIIPEFRSFKYAAAGLRFIHNPSKRFDIRLEGYGFLPISHLFELESQVPEEAYFDGSFHFAGTLIAVYHTPVGPISLSLNYYEPLYNSWSIMFHAGFLLFNKRSMD